MNIVNAVKDSKYLKQDDVGDGLVATIRSITEENLAKEGAPPENKFILHFDECKPLVINSTNAQLVARIVGSEEDGDWIGHQICLYSDPTISFGGRMVGGIRVRPVPTAAKPAAAPAPRQSAPPASSKPGPSKVHQLKARFKSHPQFGTELQAEDINAQCVQRWGVKLDKLNEMQADEALDQFDEIVAACLDSMPF